jgi:hypothetical protein
VPTIETATAQVGVSTPAAETAEAQTATPTPNARTPQTRPPILLSRRVH